MTPTVNDIPLDWFLDALRSNKPFTLSRWGDGEWRSVLGEGTGSANCDGAPYTPELTDALRQVLRRRPRYMMGLQDLAREGWGAKIEAWLKENVPEGFSWARGDVFHRGSIQGRLDAIADAIRLRTVLLVGPKHLTNIRPQKFFLEVTGFPPYRAMVVPDQQAFDVWREAVATARREIDEHGKSKDILVSISAGMAGNVILDALHESHGGLITIVDFGSLWDPLAGVDSRNYMKERRAQLEGQR
jgi:hypothetical protein